MGKVLDPLDPEKLGTKADEYEIPEAKRCKHGGHLRYMRPNEVRCDKCYVGWFIDPEDHLIDGHLYRRDKLII